jgi:hypothetical protein
MSELYLALVALPGIGPYVPYISLSVLLCSAAATQLPVPSPAAWRLYRALYRITNLVALNLGHARNAGAP